MGVSLLAGGQALVHTLQSCSNCCSPLVPQTHPNMESSYVKSNWKLSNQSLLIQPDSAHLHVLSVVQGTRSRLLGAENEDL